MKHYIEPYPHQMEILELSKKENSLALLWEMGTGKTGATINIIRNKFNVHKAILRTVILGPTVTMYNWQKEISVWSKIPEDRVKVITGSGKKRIDSLLEACSGDNIIIINWEALINDTVFNLLCDYAPMFLVGDELHYVKSHKSKRSKKAVKLSDVTRKLGGYVVGLTGTPIINSPEDIFMQYKFLDGGRIFGPNFYTFQKQYMVNINQGWTGAKSFPKWVPNTARTKELNGKVNRIATRITKDECLKDLPPLIKTRRYVELSKEQLKYYIEMKKDFITYVNSKAVVASMALTKLQKLLEITYGFMKDEEGGFHEFVDNPRLKELENLLLELTPKHKVIVWASWKHNYKMITRLCDRLKINYTTLLEKAEAKENVNLFQEDPNIRVIVGSRRVGGIGVNLTAASYSIVFSRNFSFDQEKQSEARNHRGGSQIHSQIVKIDLVTPKTADERVLEALENKQNISDKIIDWSESDGL